jgi:hypothetical protein
VSLLATWKQHVEYLRRCFIRLRYGRMHLRLPTIVMPARHTPVRLFTVGETTGQGGPPPRRRVRARPGGGHGWAGPGRGLHLTLELPPPEPAASTVLDIDSRRWELQITCEAPGVDLETTFLFPIYFSGGV